MIFIRQSEVINRLKKMSEDAGNMKLYDLLGVSKNATESEIKKVNFPKAC